MFKTTLHPVVEIVIAICIAIGGIVGILAILWFLYSFIYFINPYFFRFEKFDAVQWKAPIPITDRYDRTCYRGGMALDLRDHVLKRGMSKTYVEKLLGRPQSTRSNALYYDLGYCSLVDYDDLVIYFDAKGALVYAKIVQS